MNEFSAPAKFPGAAFCMALAVGTASGAYSDLALAPLAPVIVGKAASGSFALERPALAIRGECPTLLARPEVFDVALRLRAHLTAYLGAGTRVEFEELVDPDDPEGQPTVYAVVLLPDEKTDELLDRFIVEEWAAQPALMRLMVRIGREFV